MYSVYLADDEVWVVIGLKKHIEQMGLPFRVVGESNDGVTAMEEIEELRPDILISDIRMPGLSGLELLEELRGKKIDCKVIFVTGYAEFEYAQKALQLGASDYILKPIQKEKLKSSLEKLQESLDPAGAVAEPEENLTEEAGDELIQQIIAEIQENDTRGISLTDLSHKYKISTGYLSKMIKKELNLSFSEYLMVRRIQKAKKLLEDDKLSIDAISEMVGYNDYFYFIKVFKKATGISPSKYRESL